VLQVAVTVAAAADSVMRDYSVTSGSNSSNGSVTGQSICTRASM
jgi:hypothetical protein